MGYILIMKVLVVGFGPHGAGLEACEYYMKKGDEVTIIEMRDRSSFGLLPEKLEKEGVKLLFNTPVDDLSKYDVVVKAPAVPLNVKYFKKARYITNDLSALFESPLVEGIKLIAVVGSKGKTTSASIITHALNVLGGRAVTCGGIGKSGFHILTKLSEEGKNCYTHIVLAMANWQIGDTNYFLDKSWPGIESVLITTNTNKDNLPKELLPMLLCVKGKIVLDKEIKDHVQKRSMIEKKKFIPVPSHFNPYFYPSFEASSYEVLKSLGYSKRNIVKAFKSYKGVPDRLEQVAIKNGILYINDSASTIPESVQFAVKTMGQVSMRTGTLRSRTMRRRMACCCQSFWPKTATSAWVIMNSFSTTVQTPRKWVGRLRPHMMRERSGTSTQVAWSSAYMDAGSGMKMASAPWAAAICVSRSMSRG